MANAEITSLLAARERLARRSRDEILAVLATVIERWLEPESPWRRDAEAALVAETGFAPAMIREGLPRQLAPLRGDAIRRLLDEEGVGEDAPGPRLIAQILPGNVPALAAPAICLALAVRAAVLVKPGREERSFAPRFAASIAEADAELGACVAVRYWPGGSGEIEDEILEYADAVEVAGGDAAIDALRDRARARFLGRGARVSFAVLTRAIAADGAALASAAQGIAEDVSIWEQRGCLSPHVVFAEAASETELRRIAAALAAALEDLAHRWPPPPLSLDDKAAVLRFRQAAEWGLGGGAAAHLVAAPNLAWTIAIEEQAALRPTCLHRSIRLQPISNLDDFPALLAASRRRLECAGIAGAPTRTTDLTEVLRAAGVHRVCPVGEMQRPDLSWKPGGVGRIAWAMGERLVGC